MEHHQALYNIYTLCTLRLQVRSTFSNDFFIHILILPRLSHYEVRGRQTNMAELKKERDRFKEEFKRFKKKSTDLRTVLDIRDKLTEV